MRQHQSSRVLYTEGCPRMSAQGGRVLGLFDSTFHTGRYSMLPIHTGVGAAFDGILWWWFGGGGGFLHTTSTLRYGPCLFPKP